MVITSLFVLHTYGSCINNVGQNSHNLCIMNMNMIDSLSDLSDRACFFNLYQDLANKINEMFKKLWHVIIMLTLETTKLLNPCCSSCQLAYLKTSTKTRKNISDCVQT